MVNYDGNDIKNNPWASYQPRELILCFHGTFFSSPQLSCDLDVECRQSPYYALRNDIVVEYKEVYLTKEQLAHGMEMSCRLDEIAAVNPVLSENQITRFYRAKSTKEAYFFLTAGMILEVPTPFSRIEPLDNAKFLVSHP